MRQKSTELDLIQANPGRKTKRKLKTIGIRALRQEDIDEACDLVVRLKRLNSEFDPLLKITPGIEREARRSVRESISDQNCVILVAFQKSTGKIVGLLKSMMRDRIFYEPRKEGLIIEFYILPEFRRESLGQVLIASMVKNLEKRGADLIAAEFPSQNEIAKKFYTKLGFRSLTNVYAKSSSD